MRRSTAFLTLIFAASAVPADAGLIFHRRHRQARVQVRATCRPAQANASAYAYRATTTTTTTTTQAVYAGDALGVLNAARARRGLHALAYDAGLAASAAANNAAMSVRGLGHFISAPGASQCAAIGTPTAQAAVAMWERSPAHAALMLSPSVTRCGLAVSSNCATANFR